MSTRLVTILGGKGHHPPLGCPLGRVTTALPSPASPGLPQCTSTPRAEQPPREVQALVCEGWEAPSACFAFSVAPCHRNLCMEARQGGADSFQSFCLPAAGLQPSPTALSSLATQHKERQQLCASASCTCDLLLLVCPSFVPQDHVPPGSPESSET